MRHKKINHQSLSLLLASLEHFVNIANLCTIIQFLDISSSSTKEFLVSLASCTAHCCWQSWGGNWFINNHWSCHWSRHWSSGFFFFNWSFTSISNTTNTDMVLVGVLVLGVNFDTEIHQSLLLACWSSFTGAKRVGDGFDVHVLVAWWRGGFIVPWFSSENVLSQWGSFKKKGKVQVFFQFTGKDLPAMSKTMQSDSFIVLKDEI